MRSKIEYRFWYLQLWAHQKDELKLNEVDTSTEKTKLLNESALTNWKFNVPKQYHSEEMYEWKPVLLPQDNSGQPGDLGW